MNECILLVDDDSAITTALAIVLERPGRTVLVCSDIESAEITLEQFPVTHLVTDLQFSGAFGFEGLHFLKAVHARRRACRVILITGYDSDALRAEAIKSGAAIVLSKPFEIEELEAALGTTPNLDDTPARIIHVQSLTDILSGGSLSAAFQPIVHLDANARPFGYEALARIRGGWAAGGAAELFAYASRCSRLHELNLKALSRSIEEAGQLPSDAAVFLNVDPAVIETRGFVDSFRALAGTASLPLDRIVIEVTERSGFADERQATGVFDDLRRSGVRFALDDHGSAYSHLALMNQIKPSFIKISNAFGTDAEADETKMRIVRNVISLARDFGCRTILEGIETPDTAAMAMELGIELAQGFHFGRPQPALHWSAT
jgi:EAL domain-containing protein (putative c-di-GMP-specific phosphodiesterase class I)/ActR/RegA family two-component response regulator